MDEFEYEISSNENIKFIAPLRIEDKIVVDYNKIEGYEL